MKSTKIKKEVRNDSPGPVTVNYHPWPDAYDDIDVLDTDEDVILHKADILDTDEDLVMEILTRSTINSKTSQSTQNRRRAEARNKRA